MKINTPSFAEREIARMNQITKEAQLHKFHILNRLIQLKKEIKKLEIILESLDTVNYDIAMKDIEDYHKLWKKRYGYND